jgi:hypothetical protein
VQWLYWSSSLLALLVGVIVVALVMLGNADYIGIGLDSQWAIPLMSAGWVGISFILAGPLWLLAGCLVMAIRIGLHADWRSHPEYWRYLGWIASRIVIGTLAGIGIMLVLAVMFI